MPEKLAQETIVRLRLDDFTCPVCRSSERWDTIAPDERAGNNPSLIVLCGCGEGELRIVVE